MGLNRSCLFLWFFVVESFACLAQTTTENYFIQFKDKPTPTSFNSFLSERALKRRAKHVVKVGYDDFPVNTSYIQQVAQFPTVRVAYALKWLNGLLLECAPEVVGEITSLPFVVHTERVSANKINVVSKNALLNTKALAALDYGKALDQIQILGADKMHEANLTGKGIYIAVFDGGFQNANVVASLQDVMTQQRIKFTYNIVEKTTNVYRRNTHGTNVLSCIAAYLPGGLVGTGFGADFALIISEDVGSEKLVEEYNWMRAAEMADSVGVDIISSSLGYNTFDDPAEDHQLSQLDGHTTVITKAAQLAARKGILVVNSAGNNFNDKSWPNVVFPCDADSILAVGATNLDRSKAGFSAVGPTFDGRIKPDVASLGVGIIVNSSGNDLSGASGTSYSAPFVAGLAAGLWQLDTTLTNIELLNFIKQSSHLYCAPNNSIGYGIPNYSIAAELIKGRKSYECPLGLSNEVVYPNPVNEYISIHLDESELLVNNDFRLLEVSGREVMRGQVISPQMTKNKVDISGLKSGVYILQLAGKSYKVVKL